MNNNIEDLEDLSSSTKNASDEIDELVFNEEETLNTTDVEDLDAFAKEEGMPQRVTTNVRVDNMGKVTSSKLKDFTRDDKNKKFNNPENKKVKFNKKKLLIIPVIIIIVIAGIWISKPKNFKEVKEKVEKVIEKITSVVKKVIKNVSLDEHVGKTSVMYYIPKGFTTTTSSSEDIDTFVDSNNNRLEIFIQDDIPYSIIKADSKKAAKQMQRSGFVIKNEESSKIEKKDFLILDIVDPTEERTLNFYGELEEQKTLNIKFYSKNNEDFSPEAKKMFEKIVRSYNEQQL